MKILIKLNHPAHYHLFKNFIKQMKDRHYIKVLIRDKDILSDLLEIDEVEYERIIESKKRSRGNKFSILFANLREMLEQDINLFRHIKDYRYDILMGTDISISHIGRIFKIPSFIFNEDDFEINKMFCSTTYPYCDFIVSPSVCSVGKFGKKKIEYDGYQKLAYLHPNYFTPDIRTVNKYINSDKPFFILRLVSYTAGHDIEQKHGGISEELLETLISILLKKGNVYLTSEENLKDKFKKHLLKINPIDIHHLLAFSDLLITDSQSMTVEAAMLGTPSIRYNSFVGKISVLNEIENRYHLSTGIHINESDKLLKQVNEIVENKDTKSLYLNNRNRMLDDKADLTAFLIWLIEDFPNSVMNNRLSDIYNKFRSE